MERGVRLHVLAALTALALAACSSASAAVYMTQPQALAEAFPGARLERKAFILTEAQAKAVQQKARAKLTAH